MKGFLKRFQRFRNDEGGAVTVDWVVLTAAMTGIGIAVTSVIIDSATDPADSVGSTLTNMTIN